MSASGWMPILLLLSLGFAQTVGATDWQFIGARYQGMGGAGVAVADDSLAIYWNPGALAFTKGWDVQLPLGASVSAEGDVMLEIDRLDSFARDLRTIRRRLSNGERLSSSDRATLLQLVARDIPLFREDDEAFIPQANAVLAGRKGHFAIALIGSGESVIAPFLDELNFSLSGASTPDARIADFVGSGADRSSELSSTGQSLADAIADDFRAFTNTGLEQDQAEEFVFQAESAGLNTRRARVREGLLRAAGTTVRSGTDLVSDNVTGAAAVTLVTAETALAYGHPFFGKIGIGGVIRYIYGNTYVDYTTFYEVDSVRELIKETLEFNNRADGHEFGVDLGVLVKPVEWFRIGVVGRNLNEPDFKVDLPTPIRRELNEAGISLRTYELERQARLGTAVDIRPWWTVALDIDLTKNRNKYVPGFESRLLSMGTEVRGSYRRLGVALRGGLFMNLGNNQNRAPVLTAGIGLRAWNFTLEFAGGVSTERDRFESIGAGDRIPVRVSFGMQLGYQVEF